MSSFIALQEVLWRRLRAMRGEYAVYVLILIGIAQIALYVALPSQGTLRVAVVEESTTTVNPFAGASGIVVTRPKRAPDRADLAMGRLDAAVRLAPDGSPVLLLARSPDVATRLEHASMGLASRTDAPAKQGVASTLMGIWIMFLITVGVLCGRFYAQDKERGMLHRIGTTPTRAGVYLAANGSFTFLLCFIPTLLMVGIEGLLRGQRLGLGLPAWALLLAVTAALASAFSLLVNTLMPDQDQAVSVASMAAVFTTLLSGSFVAPRARGPVLNGVSTLMPQHAIMELTVRLENGGTGLATPLAVLTGVVVFFCLLAYLITASRLRRGKW